MLASQWTDCPWFRCSSVIQWVVFEPGPSGVEHGGPESKQLSSETVGMTDPVIDQNTVKELETLASFLIAVWKEKHKHEYSVILGQIQIT